MSEFTTQGRAEEMPDIHNEILHCEDYMKMDFTQIIERRDYFQDLLQHPLVNDRQTEEL